MKRKKIIGCHVYFSQLQLLFDCHMETADLNNFQF